VISTKTIGTINADKAIYNTKTKKIDITSDSKVSLKITEKQNVRHIKKACVLQKYNSER
jgi:hypothetical protein